MENKQEIEIHDKTLVILPVFKNDHQARILAPSRLAEAVGLAEAIDLEVVRAEIVPLAKVFASSLMGKGKLEELANIIKEHEIKLAVIDSKISPIQQRNLEKALNCKVIDRSALIIEIFGKRARTNEGKLQVELALLEYQKSRLVRSWTHLERQRGGHGFLAGPGETQLESDRRVINDKITRIKRELDTVKNTRAQHRKSRQKVPYPVVALVGYTNAGKTTLFNLLTGDKQLAADMLFATLDPTMRMITLPSKRKIILSDTVGFISELPTELIAAFRATLEEVVEADVILHVRDIANPETHKQREDVLKILQSLGLTERLQEEMIEILNKIDLLDINEASEISFGEEFTTVPVSALSGKGKEELLQAIDYKLSKDERMITLAIASSEGELLAWIYRHSEVIERYDQDNEINLTIRIATKNEGMLGKMLEQKSI